MSKQSTMSPLNLGEPQFIIRAKDNYSVAVLRLLQNIYDIEEDVIIEFETWRKENPDKCKDPN